jgi:hypothetical protein
MSRYKTPSLSRATSQPDGEELDERGYKAQQRKLAISKAIFGSKLSRWFFGILAFITLTFLLVFFWHLLAPTCCRWLPAEEVENLKSLAISIMVGLLMSGITSYFFANYDVDSK